MPRPELEKYIQTLRDQNISDDVIQTNLLKTGWSEKDVAEAISPVAGSTSMPLPPTPHFGMWVAFQYMLLFICLYVSAISLAGIMHLAVNQNITDSLDQSTYRYYGGDESLMKGFLAGILVAFPIFAALFMILKRQALVRPAIKGLRARKILIYLTLVVTFLFLIGHLIGTIYGFLGGTTTFRSFAHLMVTFLVAGSIFGYLLMEVREDRKTT